MLATSKKNAKKLYGIFDHDNDLIAIYSTRELAKENLKGLTKEDIEELGLQITPIVYDYKAIF